MGEIVDRNFLLKNGDVFLVRTVFPADAEKVLEFHKGIFRDARYLVTTLEEFDLTVEQEEEWLQNIYKDKNKLSIAAVHNGHLIGYLGFQNGDRFRMKHQGSFGMSVANSFRNQGVGKALLSVLIDWAKKNSTIEKVCLEVFAQNVEAIHLYKYFGFMQEGLQTKAIKINDQNYHDVILMAYFVK
jgi:RimJ/RimL family protein N-acetyltransferase